MEVKLGKAPSSKKEEEVEVVQLVGVVLRRPPVKLRRVGALMVDERVKLLHGLE